MTPAVRTGAAPGRFMPVVTTVILWVLPSISFLYSPMLPLWACAMHTSLTRIIGIGKGHLKGMNKKGHLEKVKTQAKFP